MPRHYTQTDLCNITHFMTVRLCVRTRNMKVLRSLIFFTDAKLENIFKKNKICDFYSL